LIYQSRYDDLLSICKQITTHRQKLAKPRIEEMILRTVDPHTSNENLLSHLIAESLLKRIDRQLLESKNIYIQQFDIAQTALFYSMAEAVPFVYSGHYLANQYLLKTAEDLKSLTILDIGMGSGKQLRQFLGMLAKSKGTIEAVNVIGLDPVQQNINDSQKTLDELQKELHFDLKFYPVCSMIEQLNDNDFDSIRAIGGKNLLVNTSFSFHHTSHPLHDNEMRTGLLRKIASLKPLAFTMVEPSSNHDTEELSKRLHNSWQHFGNVFALVDESKIEASHKFLIKERFFGREIRDIFGVSDHFRCERHELYESWLLRLHRAGFKPVDFTGLRLDLPVYCQYSITEGLVRMNYNDITIVAVLASSL